jgi:hypothetical protein
MDERSLVRSNAFEEALCARSTRTDGCIESLRTVAPLSTQARDAESSSAVAINGVVPPNAAMAKLKTMAVAVNLPTKRRHTFDHMNWCPAPRKAPNDRTANTLAGGGPCRRSART